MYPVKDVIEEVNRTRGVSGGWPSVFKYDYEESGRKARILLNTEEAFNKDKKKTLRQLDSWGFAFYSHLNTSGIPVEQLCFAIDFNIDIYLPDFEAFKRRLSYLNLNNEFEISLWINKEGQRLYSADGLFNRPENEVVRDLGSINPGGDDDKPGRLEKDFQAFLFGRGLHGDQDNPDRSSERLALLGEDFFNLKKTLNAEQRWLFREFPTGVFNEKIENQSRIMPTEFVDLVGLNKNGRLSVIELKVNDPKLEVMSQLLDYALFFRTYLWNDVKKNGCFQTGNPIKRWDYFICYVVNNHYHPRFDNVFFNYFSPKDPGLNEFAFVKLTLGLVQKTARNPGI
ncbi:MAG: hypothetical protein D3926_08605 [Desulfobacteraceae bacterium]|nr:MAG: hypothetical protein D3926_08605 [Desulfobacteraceae bacterium]